MKNLINILHTTRILASKDNDVKISKCVCHHSETHWWTRSRSSGRRFLSGQSPSLPYIYPRCCIFLQWIEEYHISKNLTPVCGVFMIFSMQTGYFWWLTYPSEKYGLLRNDESFHALREQLAAGVQPAEFQSRKLRCWGGKDAEWHIWLLVWTIFIFHFKKMGYIILPKLTNSIIFQRGRSTTKRCTICFMAHVGPLGPTISTWLPGQLWNDWQVDVTQVTTVTYHTYHTIHTSNINIPRACLPKFPISLVLLPLRMIVLAAVPVN